MTIVFSIVTAVTAIIGIFMSRWQIRNSNKQSLFDKRLQIFLFVNGLSNLLHDTPELLREKEHIRMANQLDFQMLTNNTELSNITSAIQHLEDSDKHNAFLKELELFKIREQTAKFIFKDPTAAVLSNFIQSYRELLLSTYQYEILLDDISHDSKQFGWTLKEAASQLSEETRRVELNKKINALNQNFHAYESDTMQRKIKKQINLSSL